MSDTRFPDKTVVEVLERWLAEAKEGRFAQIAIVGIQEGEDNGISFTISKRGSDDGGFTFELVGAIDYLKYKAFRIAHNYETADLPKDYVGARR